ncbi:TLDc domain-containing protein [Entamoeba marina]
MRRSFENEILELCQKCNQSNYKVLFDSEIDEMERKVVNSKIVGRERVMVVCAFEEIIIGYYTESQIPQDDDKWKVVGNSNAFGFVVKNGDFEKDSVLSERNSERRMYLNINDDDDNVIIAIRKLFFIRKDDSYLSTSCHQLFEKININDCYPHKFQCQRLCIVQLQ